MVCNKPSHARVRSLLMNRRIFIAAATGAAASRLAHARRASLIRGVAFDAFAIFDPRSIAAACERMFGARGPELANLWRARQFEYQWLRALGGRYQDFWRCTAAALEFACASLGLDADAARREALMNEYLRMPAWPDVPAALHALRERGLRLALLSNATDRILVSGLARAGLAGLFAQVISTDRIRTFKPDPRAYQLGVDVMGLPREEILFVPFAGWDLAGAQWSGYRTFWNNRAMATAERLDVVTPDGGATLADLVRFVDRE